MTPSPELAILRFLARRTHAAASMIGAACAMSPAEVRARLVMLESMRFIAGRQDKSDGQPRRVYVVTHEGAAEGGVGRCENARQRTFETACTLAVLTLRNHIVGRNRPAPSLGRACRYFDVVATLAWPNPA